jgi:hypothetical protein
MWKIVSHDSKNEFWEECKRNDCMTPFWFAWVYFVGWILLKTCFVLGIF